MKPIRRVVQSIVLASAVVSTACVAVFGLDSHSSDERLPEDGDATGDGDGATAEADTDACSEELGCAPCAVVYVGGASSNDANDGCSKDKPKHTIESALAVVRGGAYPTKDIHVCRGTYVEDGLTIDRVVNVRGGYECDTWKRNVVDLTAQNGTVVRNASYDASPITMKIALPAGTSPVIEGLTVHGGPAAGVQGTNGANAVLVTSGAPLIRWNHFLGGGATSATGDGSVGMLVTSPDAPEITQNWIEGGTGAATAPFNFPSQVGSAALILRVTGAAAAIVPAPFVHDNTLIGGTGTVAAGFGSAGLVIARGASYRGTRAIRGNRIEGGAATNTSLLVPVLPQDCESAGVVILNDGDVELIGNTILARTGTSATSESAGARYATAAVFSNLPAFMRVDGNRIYAGEGSTNDRIRGIVVAMAGPVEVTNNFIHGGQARGLGTAGGDSAAIALARFTSSTVVRNNTVIIAPATGFSTSVGIDVGDGFVQPRGAIVQNNLFLGTVSGVWSAQFGVRLLQCPSQLPLASFASNLFVSVQRAGASLLSVQPSSCASTANSVDALEATLAVSGEARDNVRFEPPACPSDTGCVPAAGCAPDGGISACIASLFEPPGGTFAMFADGGADGGVLLRATASCRATQGAWDVTATGFGALDASSDAPTFSPVVVDFFGNPRTGDGGRGLSYGAHEQNSLACAPP